MKKQWRTLQPPHQSEKFTLEEAMEAWRIVEGKAGKPRLPRNAAPDPEEKSDVFPVDD